MAVKAKASISLVRIDDGIGIDNITNYYKVSTKNIGETAPQVSGGVNLTYGYYGGNSNGITVSATKDTMKVSGTNTQTTAYGCGGFKVPNGSLVPLKKYTLTTSVPLPKGVYIGLNTKKKSDGVDCGAFSEGYLFGDGKTKQKTLTATSDTDGSMHAFIGILGECKSVNVEFKVKLERGVTSTPWTPAPESLGWSTTPPLLTQTNKYLWNYEVISGSGGTSISHSTPAVIGVYGDKGTDGANGTGIKLITEHYQITPDKKQPTSWVAEPPTLTSTNKYLWNYETITYTNGTSIDTAKRIIGVYGDKGLDGSNGKDGLGIASIVNYYLAHPSNSNVTTQTTGWTTNFQTTDSNKKYLWNYEKITYTNKTSYTTVPCIIGTYSKDGQNGTDGVGITSLVEYYQISTSNTTAPTSWSTTPPTLTPINKYLWNYEKITYTNKSTYETKKRVIGVYGDKGENGQNGSDGIGISQSKIEYATSTSGTVIPNSNWSTTIPSLQNGQYLWTKTTITYTNKSTSVSYSVSRSGTDGNNGADGNGIQSATATYQTSADGVNIPTGEWSPTIPKTDASKPYLWTRVITTYTNGTSTTAYSVGSTIDGVAVGGRNLLLKSDTDYTNTSYPTSIYTMSEKMVEGITYTCQIWGTLGSGKTHYGLWLNGGMIHLCNMVDNKDGTHTATFVGKNDESEISTINVYPVPSSVSVENTIYRIKLEKGNQATDYTVAPEDLKEEIDGVIGGVIGEVNKTKTSISQLEDSIAMLVVDENGNSLMTQKGDHWQFDMGAIQSTVDTTAKKLTDMSGDIDSAKELANKTHGMAEALNAKTAFITMGRTETYEPYILLGNGNSDFKLRISNTSIDFLDGTEKVAYISNKVLNITKTIIKDELQFGDTKGWIWKNRTNGNLGIRWIGNIKDIEPEVPEVLPEIPAPPDPQPPTPPEPQYPPNDSVIDLDSSDITPGSMQWNDRSPNKNNFTLKEGTPNLNGSGLLMTSCKVWGTKPIALGGAFSYLVELTLENESTGAIFSLNQSSASKYCDNVEKNTWKLNGYSGDTITSVTVPSNVSVKIAVVRDTYGDTKVYKNGVLQGSFARGSFVANGEFSVVLGASSWGGFPNTQGLFRLKRLRIFNKVISDDVIRSF